MSKNKADKEELRTVERKTNHLDSKLERLYLEVWGLTWKVEQLQKLARTMIAVVFVVVAVLVGAVLGAAAVAKADTHCRTVCEIDGWGERVCTTICQEY